MMYVGFFEFFSYVLLSNREYLGEVWVWRTEKCERAASVGGWSHRPQLTHTHTLTRLVKSSLIALLSCLLEYPSLHFFLNWQPRHKQTKVSILDQMIDTTLNRFNKTKLHHRIHDSNANSTFNILSW